MLGRLFRHPEPPGLFVIRYFGTFPDLDHLSQLFLQLAKRALSSVCLFFSVCAGELFISQFPLSRVEFGLNLPQKTFRTPNKKVCQSKVSGLNCL